MLILAQTLLHFKEHKIIYWNKVQRISSLEQSFVSCSIWLQSKKIIS